METITLKTPFKSPDTGATVSQVEIRAPKAGDLFAIAKMNAASQEEKAFELVRRCITNLSPGETAEIALSDFFEITRRVNEGAPGFPQPSSAEAT